MKLMMKMLRRLLSLAFSNFKSLGNKQKMTAKNDDFAPLPTYTETSTSNSSWVNVTLTKTELDGTKTQVSAIVSKK
jgi:hypothetical protein